MRARPIVTPEAVSLEFEIAGIGSRSLALALDWFIQGVAGFALLFGYVSLVDRVDLTAGIAQAGFFLIGFLVMFGYPVGSETLWRGRTVGKAALGLRVVTVEGGPVRFRHAVIRALLGLVDILLTSGAVAILSILLTTRNQRLGDLVAGTLVLRERSGVPAPAAMSFSVPPGLEEYAARLDVSGITDADYRPVRAFLMRAPNLRPQARYDLATQLANQLASRVRPAPPQIQPEDFLACLAATYQRRHTPATETPSIVPEPPSTVPEAPVAPASPPADGGGGGFRPME